MEGLNSEQQTAVKTATRTHVAVMAGPGTGKTHTLIAVVQNLLDSGVSPEKLVILTFTNKAADELAARLQKHNSATLPAVTTFHAWAYQQIKRSLGGKKLLDAFEQRQHILELRKQTGSKSTTRELNLLISRAKNGSDTTPKSLALLKAYDELLARDGLIDFDDLLRLYLESSHTTSYTHVLVDEFQDTSPLQYRVLQRYITDGAKLFVIGDPNQSIYGFRGAGGEVFDAFTNDCQPTAIRLTHNYRSARAIVETAGGIFPDAKQQAVHAEAGNVQVVETLDAFSEADYIIRTIEQVLGGTDWDKVHHDERLLAAENFQDFAVLYRQNRRGKQLAEKLRAAGLPVQITGEDSPYATPLAQAVLAAMCYCMDANDDTKRQALQAARLVGVKSTGWLDALDSSQPSDAVAADVLRHFGKVEQTDFQPVLNSLHHYPDLAAAITHWQVLAEQDFYDPTADCITLSTIHASKGLEFRHVFVAGCNEGLLPHDKGDIAEEKRLFYVAVTRAIETLTLLYSRRKDGQPARPSRFLMDIKAARQTDPALEMTEKRRARTRLKRAQQTLF
jgi:superfamily I DNA/RNA helicase